jgi:hypothetical protein
MSNKFPKLQEIVDFEIKEYCKCGVYVSLPKYDNIEAMILYGIEWDCNNVNKKGCVTCIDEEKGYIRLSNKNID